MKHPTNSPPEVYSWHVQESAYRLLCSCGMDYDRAAYVNHLGYHPARFVADREWWLYRHYINHRDNAING